jgi:PAS domain-containing protein
MEVAVRTPSAAAATRAGGTAPVAGDPAAAAAVPRDVRRLARGESLVASAGIALAAILLAAVSGVGYWASRDQATDAELDAASRARTLAAAMAPGAELLIATDDLSTLRRIVVETARAENLAGCEVVLPDGRVVASSTPSRITAVKLPAAWSEKVTPPDAGPLAAAATGYTQPLNVPKRGVAFLRLAAAVPDTTDRRLETLTYVGAVGAAAMLAVLLVYRRVRWNLRAVAAVREALLTLFPPGTTAPAGVASLVSPDLGPEAAAWNALVAERDQVRRDALAERARESLGRRRQPRGDLDAACDAMSQGLILVDEQGRVKYANGAAAAFLASTATG